MNRIAQLHLNNFKFFGQEKPIQLDGRHLLLYGENGSGKSTIYWSLYTLFEAALKNEDEEIKKYFRKGAKEEYSLVNIHAPEVAVGSGNFDSFVQLTTNDITPLRFRIALDDVAIRGNDDAKKVNYASDFIQYKLLQSLHSFWHKDPIDLVDFFTDHTLQHVQFDEIVITRNGTQLKLTNAFDIWNQILTGPEWTTSRGKTPKRIRVYKGSPPYIEFEKMVADFNEGMEKLIAYVNKQAEDFLQRLGYTSFKFYLKYSNASFIKKDIEYNAIPFKVALIVSEYEGKKDVVHRAHSFLNEAKLSAMGIAVRLAVLHQKLKHNGLKFIVLDDLLISLDMRNRERVLDLFLSDDFSKNYQLLILTHDRHFYEMAKRKIKDYNQKDDWVYYEMYSQEDGKITKPYITQEEGYLGKAMHFYNLFENDVAANFLRKEAESFCKIFLPPRLSLASDGRHKDLSRMIQESITFADKNNIDSSLLKILQKHRQFILNPGSHDSYDVPKFRNEVMDCHKVLTSLQEIRIKKLLEKNDRLYFEVSNAGNVWRAEIVLDDELRLLQEVGKGSILLEGRINYTMLNNGAPTAKGLQHGIENIGSFYSKCYAKASDSGLADFWDGIFITSTGAPLRSIKAF